MEGISQHLCLERDELRAKIQDLEASLTEERLRVVQFQRDDIQSLRERNRDLEKKLYAERAGSKEELIKGQEQNAGRSPREQPRLTTEGLQQPNAQANGRDEGGHPLSPSLSDAFLAGSNEGDIHSSLHSPHATAGKSKRALEDGTALFPPQKRSRVSGEHPAHFNRRQEVTDKDRDVVENSDGGPVARSGSTESRIAALLAGHFFCPTLSIVPAPSCPPVTPAFLKSVYDATKRRPVYLIPAHKNPSSQGKPMGRYIAWPSLVENPLMPRTPGQPGMLFFLDNHGVSGTYLGEYKSEIIGRMTKEWFSTQQENVYQESMGYVLHGEVFA
ncbi:hypothetical protein BKA70DRAFT_1315042 [Coprinopsis sp. MPI-PUGE-AT-0042]|nr:hypothetical protein BKA70DRAFT_1315042 [Coprinopsis sp. MPI-PUGE-AT-0042]